MSTYRPPCKASYGITIGGSQDARDTWSQHVDDTQVCLSYACTLIHFPCRPSSLSLTALIKAGSAKVLVTLHLLVLLSCPYHLLIAKEALHKILAEAEDVPLLVLANKRDVGETLSDSDISEGLELSSLKPSRPWAIKGISGIVGIVSYPTFRLHANKALPGDGISDALDFLCTACSTNAKQQKPLNKLRVL